MLKKILVISTMIAAANVAVAGNPAPYVGGGLGLVSNYEADPALRTQAASRVEYKISGVSSRGIPVNVFAGYGGAINQNFYLAGELGGTLATMDLTDKDIAKTTYSYSASIIPGLILSDHTIAFARLGLIRSHFNVIKVPGAKSADFSQTGGQIGLGLQTSVTQNIDVRGEYDYVAYKKSKLSDVGAYSGEYKPRSNQFNVAVIYKFD